MHVQHLDFKSAQGPDTYVLNIWFLFKGYLLKKYESETMIFSLAD